MSSSNNITRKSWVLQQHPTGDFSAKTDAKLITDIINLDLVDFNAPSIAIETNLTPKKEENDKSSKPATTALNREGGLSLSSNSVIVATSALSVDAFLRTMLDSSAYHGSIHPGSTLPSIGYGTVVKASPNSKFKVGNKVMGMLGATTVSIVDDKELNKLLAIPYIPSSLFLGYLGLSGLTAYVGVHCVSKSPRKGETVVVSAAAGGCGNLAAQIAKVTGARVIGVCGGKEKKDWCLNVMKLDGCIDYKDKSQTLDEQMAVNCPDGVDFFFDNVGGEILDAVLMKINLGARVVICGAASNYNSGAINNKNDLKVKGPSAYTKLAEKSSSMTGFNVMHNAKSFIFAIPYLMYHYWKGDIVNYQSVENGIEEFGGALEGLFGGGWGGGKCGRIIVDVDGAMKLK